MSDDLEGLKKRQTLRLAMLKAIFDLTIGKGEDPSRHHFSPNRLYGVYTGGDRYKLNDFVLALQYLSDEHLLKAEAEMADYREQGYTLTHWGIKEVEQAIENPDQRTQHFMLSVIQHFHGNVGAVQTGSQATANIDVEG